MMSCMAVTNDKAGSVDVDTRRTWSVGGSHTIVLDQEGSMNRKTLFYVVYRRYFTHVSWVILGRVESTPSEPRIDGRAANLEVASVIG